MRNRLPLVLFSLTALSVVSLWAAPAAATYQVDPVHSTARFKVKHLSTSWFFGRFTGISGSVVFDQDDSSNSSVSIEIKADSIATKADRLNAHVKSPDFLNAVQFPVISFKSTKVEKNGEKSYRVTGDLSIRGVTKSITVPVEHVGNSNIPNMGERQGFSTSFEINRRDFDVNYGADNVVGDNMTIYLDIEAVKR